MLKSLRDKINNKKKLQKLLKSVEVDLSFLCS